MTSAVLLSGFCVLLASGLGACGRGDSASAGDPAAPAASLPGWPRTVEVFGRELTLSAPPERILPANAAALDFALALVDAERIAAIPATTFGWTRSALDPEAWRERSFERYLVEPVLAFSPDLVLTHVWQNADTSGLLESSGLPLVRIPSVHSYEDVRGTLEQLGRVLGAEQRAASVIAALDVRVAALRAAASAAPGAPGPSGSSGSSGSSGKRPRALAYSNLGSGGWVAARGTTADLVFELAGLENAATTAGFESHHAIDLETLLTLDPDVIVVGASTDADGESPTARYIASEPALAGLGARVIVLSPALFTTASQHLIEAAEVLAARVREPAAARDE